MITKGRKGKPKGKHDGKDQNKGKGMCDVKGGKNKVNGTSMVTRRTGMGLNGISEIPKEKGRPKESSSLMEKSEQCRSKMHNHSRLLSNSRNQTLPRSMFNSLRSNKSTGLDLLLRFHRLRVLMVLFLMSPSLTHHILLFGWCTVSVVDVMLVVKSAFNVQRSVTWNSSHCLYYMSMTMWHFRDTVSVK